MKYVYIASGIYQFLEFEDINFLLFVCHASINEWTWRAEGFELRSSSYIQFEFYKAVVYLFSPASFRYEL